MYTKVKIIFTAILLILSINLFSQTVEELYSPLFLGMGVTTTSLESPVGDAINPAASGAKQRVNLDLSYINLAGFGDEENMGHAGNLGITIPANFGVFSFSGHFLTSPFNATNLGTMGGLNASFAKDLYEDFLIGLGVSFLAGAQGDNSDWGLGADLGFLHLVGDFLFLKDFRWGFAFRGLGKAYQPSAEVRLFPRAFTPSLGFYFKLIKTDVFTWALAPDISVPGVAELNNFRFFLGTEIGILDFLFINGGLNYDLLEWDDDSTNRPIFALGLSVKFKLDIEQEIEFLDISQRGWNRSDIKLNFCGTPLQNNVWGIGGGLNMALGVIDEKSPQIDMQIEETVYVSPNLDGEADDFILPMTIEDERYVKGYKLTIMDENGNVVKEIVNKDERPENVTFENVVDRMLYVKKGITVPESLRWDGRSEQGTVVNDGEYTYQIESWDDNGNLGVTEKRKIVVDNTPPAVTLSAPYLIFSPNEDGNKDVLELELEGSQEDLWLGSVTNTSGEEVTTFNWKNSPPESFTWDGKDNQGILVPDGVYHFSINSRDRAGNKNYEQLANIIVDTRATPITMNIDMATFSPNGDNVKDVLKFILNVPVTSGIESWQLRVLKGERLLRVFSGTNEIKPVVEFDGRDDGGNVLAEGEYRGVLEILYVNGNNPSAESPGFIVDLTKPRVAVDLDYAIFSPNNDGNKDFVTIHQDTSAEIEWIGEIKDDKQNLVRKITWKGNADPQIQWFGRDDEGKLLPDGAYSYKLYSTDEAGNYGESRTISTRLDTKETEVFLTTNLMYFSPNNDGVKDTITITPHLSVKTGVDNYTLSIKKSSGQIVRKISERGKAPFDYKWDAKDDGGKMVADGEYLAELNILYTNGNNPVAVTNSFIIDTVFPEIKISEDRKLFSPDGDGRFDEVHVKQESSEEDLWEAQFSNSKAEVVKNIFWKGMAGDVWWDGRDDNRNKLPDGLYNYTIACTDKAGNKRQAEIRGLEIDTVPTPVYVVVEKEGLSPNNDGYLDTIDFKLYVTVKKGVKSWQLELIHDLEGPQIVFSGAAEIPEKITWDGKKDKKLVKEGLYNAVLTVEYFKGNMPVERTRSFLLDVTPPVLKVEMNPQLFSPDNDGLDDELFIKAVVEDISPIAQWKYEIFDPTGKHFITFQGTGRPSETIIWDGISDKGELVESAEDYPIVFEVTDNQKMKTRIENMIPVDVLVIRDGDRLKIRVPSITFVPNTDDYLNVTPEQKEKNLKTLRRLAEIFKKYSSYNIEIEGHAVNVFWNDPARAKKNQETYLVPLSKKRAESVKKGLVELGIDAGRITTIGIGGARPVVPFSDDANNWKNRRVEFNLIRKK